MVPAVTGYGPAVTGFGPAVTGYGPGITGYGPGITGYAPAACMTLYAQSPLDTPPSSFPLQAVRETSGFTERVHLFLDLIVSYEVTTTITKRDIPLVNPWRLHPLLSPPTPGPVLPERGDTEKTSEGPD